MMEKSFACVLIQSLIKQDIIKEGITIPYLMGAYKIKNQDATPVTQDYIRTVFHNIIEHSENELWIKSCTNVNNHKTISLIDKVKDKDIIDDCKYKRIYNSFGKPILFFEEYFECSNPTEESISAFFWTKYKDECFVPLKYSYTAGKWGDISEKEKDIIKKL